MVRRVLGAVLQMVDVHGCSLDRILLATGEPSFRQRGGWGAVCIRSVSLGVSH